MTRILVERLETVTGRLNSQPLWLVWVGIQMLSVEEIWQLDLRRSSPESIGIASAKLSLHWTVPGVEHKANSEGRWSDLMPLLSWQLWLAKAVGAGSPIALKDAQRLKNPPPPRD